MIEGINRAIEILEEQIKLGVPGDEEAVLEDLILTFKDEINKYKKVKKWKYLYHNLWMGKRKNK